MVGDLENLAPCAAGQTGRAAFGVSVFHCGHPFSLRGTCGAFANSPAAARRVNFSMDSRFRYGFPAIFTKGSSQPFCCHRQIVGGVRPMPRQNVATDVSGGMSAVIKPTFACVLFRIYKVG